MRAASVTAALTVKRRNRPVVENDDYAACTGRVIRAQGRRIAAGGVEGRTELLALEDQLARAVSTAVTGLRGCGYSWAEIAARTATTRQAAHQRWGHCEHGPDRTAATDNGSDRGSAWDNGPVAGAVS